MRWRKRGQIFDPRDHTEWAGSHAQVPTVLVKDDTLRIYYASRDTAGRSYTTFVDVAREDPSHILRCHKLAVLTSSEPGTFDDDGIMPAFVMEHEEKIYLYYTGWNRRSLVPYHNAIGLAVSEDGGETFSRLFGGPILDRTPVEPYLAVMPWVLREDHLWRMWYSSGTEWRQIDEKYEPIYVIKYAESRDGICWHRPNISCVRQAHELEVLSHPSVINIDGRYHMWFCFRDSRDYRDGTGGYRIGYACSDDGVTWDRTDDDAGLDVSPSGWDSRATSYPYVVAVDGTPHMFYNGNGFGKTGIGYAVLDRLR